MQLNLVSSANAVLAAVDWWYRRCNRGLANPQTTQQPGHGVSVSARTLNSRSSMPSMRPCV